MRTTRWLLIPLLLLPPITIAQESGQVPYIETLDVTVHTIDVVVTDKSGKPVTGLRQEDFELLEDGKPQPISNFSVYTEDSGAAAFRPPDVGGLKPAAPREAEDSRKFIFYIDEMALPQPTQKKLHMRLNQILDETFRPGDEGLVLRPTKERLGAGFTADRAALTSSLNAAIADQKWRFSPLQYERYQLNLEMRGAGSPRERRIAARRIAGLIRQRVQQRLGNLKSAVTAASALPGRKVLVVVTDSLPMEPGRELFLTVTNPLAWPATDENDAFGAWTTSENQSTAVDIDWYNLEPLVREIGRAASTGGITIYSIQPEFELGLAAPGDASARAVPTSQRILSAPPTSGMNLMLDDAISNTESTMRILADITGGTWYRGGGGPDRAARQILSDVHSYYSLGYRAADVSDVAHKVEVRVKGHSDLKVRARKEVLRKSPEREMTDRVVAALVAPPPPQEIPIKVEVEAGKSAFDKSQRIVNVHTLVPLSALTFLPAGDVYRAQFTVHYAAMGKSSDFVSGVQPPQVVEVPAAELEKAKSTYWRYTVPLNMRPGKHDVVIGVLDSLSRVSGIDRGTITVN